MCVCVCVCVCVCASVFVCLYMYVCLCVRARIHLDNYLVVQLHTEDVSRCILFGLRGQTSSEGHEIILYVKPIIG